MQLPLLNDLDKLGRSDRKQRQNKLLFSKLDKFLDQNVNVVAFFRTIHPSQRNRQMLPR